MWIRRVIGLIAGQAVLCRGAEEAGAAARPAPIVPRRGQFPSSEAFAEAMHNQLRVPYPIAFRFAEMQRMQAQQTLAFINALSDWLGSVESQMPDPVQIAEPIAQGLTNTFLEGPRHEMKDLNELIMAASPIQLDAPQAPTVDF